MPETVTVTETQGLDTPGLRLDSHGQVPVQAKAGLQPILRFTALL